MTVSYVLVVDDMLVNRRLLSHALAPTPVEEAGNAAAALECFFRTPPQAIILDLNLPEVDGLTVLRLVRQDDRRRGRNTPVIVVTGEGTRERVREASNLGIQGFFVKPLNPQAVRDRVAEFAPEMAAVTEPADMP